MLNKTCFECSQPITEDLYSGVRVHGRLYDFHRNCARQIIAAHIIDTLDREAHTVQRAAEQEKVEVLADRLGYRKLDQVCEQCGFEMGFHSTDTGACPTSNNRKGGE